MVKIKLKKLIDKKGYAFVAILLGYRDTSAIKKWLTRGIPKSKEKMVRLILKMSETNLIKQVKEML